MNQLNVLLITTDQEQSFAHLPESLVLPGHEYLRERGVAFRNFQVNSTPCGPSRSVIYSGQHTQHTRMFVNPNIPPSPELPRDMPSMGTIFRDLGYYTAYKGKWHLSNVNHGLDFHGQRFPETTAALEPWGFSEYTHDGDHHGLVWDGFMHDAAIAADAANWLLGKSGDKPDNQPWLLAVNFINPHDIMFFDATGRMAKERIDPVRVAPMRPAPGAPIYDDWLDLELPGSFDDDLAAKPAAHRDDQRLADIMYGTLPHNDEAGWRTFRNYYYNCIRDVDRHMLRVLEALEASGEADRTIVVFTSDHGEMAGAHGMRQKGASMYRENIGVSFIVNHPDVASPCESDAAATTVDIIPTLLAMTGVDTSEVAQRWPDLKGVSVAGALSGEKTERDARGMLINYTASLAWDVELVELLFRAQIGETLTNAQTSRLEEGVSRDNYACFRGINDGRYKFARYFKPRAHHTPTDWDMLTKHNQLELYDTLEDPLEMHNLANQADDHQALILSLNDALNRLVALEIGLDDGSCYSRKRSYSLG